MVIESGGIFDFSYVVLTFENGFSANCGESCAATPFSKGIKACDSVCERFLMICI
jgi:hypothetical protein